MHFAAQLGQALAVTELYFYGSRSQRGGEGNGKGTEAKDEGQIGKGRERREARGDRKVEGDFLPNQGG